MPAVIFQNSRDACDLIGCVLSCAILSQEAEPNMRYLQSGLITYDRGRATEGYTLFSPLAQLKTYLIDMEGQVVHEWDLPSPPGNYAYLQSNGNLMAACRTDGRPKSLAAASSDVDPVAAARWEMPPARATSTAWWIEAIQAEQE